MSAWAFQPITLAAADIQSVVPGNIKVWTGAEWEAKPIMAWNGDMWVVKVVKYWNGTSWIVTPY